MGYSPWGHKEADITEQQQQYHQKKFNLYLHKKCCFFRMKVQLIATYHYLFEVVNSFAKNSSRGKISLSFFTTTSKLPQNLKDKLSYAYKCSTGFSRLLTPRIDFCQVPARFPCPHLPPGLQQAACWNVLLHHRPFICQNRQCLHSPGCQRAQHHPHAPATRRTAAAHVRRPSFIDFTIALFPPITSRSRKSIPP